MPKCSIIILFDMCVEVIMASRYIIIPIKMLLNTHAIGGIVS